MEAGPQLKSGLGPSKVVRRAVSLNDIGLRKDSNNGGNRDYIPAFSTTYTDSLATSRGKRNISDSIPGTKINCLGPTSARYGAQSGAQGYPNQGQSSEFSSSIRGVAGPRKTTDETTEGFDYRNNLGSCRNKNEPLEDDTFTKSLILFELASARITQFSTSTNPSPSPGSSSSSNTKFPKKMVPVSQYPRLERIVAEGIFQIYTIHNGLLTYLRCGSIVHPILPRLKLWRTGLSEFILPQPIPGKYWRIEVDSVREDVLDRLDAVLSLATVFYSNVYVPDDFNVRMNMVKKILEEEDEKKDEEKGEDEEEKKNLNYENTTPVEGLAGLKAPVKSSIVAQMVGKFDTLDISTPRKNNGFQQRSVGLGGTETIRVGANKKLPASTNMNMSKLGSLVTAATTVDEDLYSSSASSTSTLDGYLDKFQYDITNNELEDEIEKPSEIYRSNGYDYEFDSDFDLDSEDFDSDTESRFPMNIDKEDDDYGYSIREAETEFVVKKTRSGLNRINNINNTYTTVNRKSSMNSCGTSTTMVSFSDSVSSTATLSPPLISPIGFVANTMNNNKTSKSATRCNGHKPRWASFSQISARSNHVSPWTAYVNAGQSTPIAHRTNNNDLRTNNSLPTRRVQSLSQSLSRGSHPESHIHSLSQVQAQPQAQPQLQPQTQTQPHQPPLSSYQVLETLLDTTSVSISLSGQGRETSNTRRVTTPGVGMAGLEGRRIRPRPKSMYNFSVPGTHEETYGDNQGSQGNESRGYLSKMFSASRGWAPWR